MKTKREEEDRLLDFLVSPLSTLTVHWAVTTPSTLTVHWAVTTPSTLTVHWDVTTPLPLTVLWAVTEYSMTRLWAVPLVLTLIIPRARTLVRQMCTEQIQFSNSWI